MAGKNHIGPIQWSDILPKRGPRFIPVLSPKGGSKVVAVITSETWKGVYTHYYEQRTRPCTGSEIDCEGCYRKLARRWKAYLCGVLPLTGSPVVVELTQGAMESCPGFIEKGKNYRGQKITLWRRNAAKNAPVHCRLEGLETNHPIPSPFDLMEALCQIWGLRHDQPVNVDLLGDE